MPYDPANPIYVAFALETASVTESTDGIALPTKATEPGAFTIVGMLSNTPDVQRNLNNSFGFAVGSSKGAYKKRGARNPSMSFPLKVTNIGILAHAIRDSSTLQLPRLCFVIGRPGQWTLMVRDAKINTAQISGKQNTTGEANEIEAQISIEACYSYMRGTPLSATPATLLAALGSPYFWHDTRQFKISDGAATPTLTDYRSALTTWSVSMNNNLTRHGLRPNFGDNCELSNTNEFLEEGNEQITGEIGLDGRLQEALLTGAVEAQNWGDITTLLSNVPAVATGGKQMLLTMGNCMPQTANMPGVESNAQLASAIPYLAQSLAFSTPS